MTDKNPQDSPRSFYEEINVAGNQLIERLNSLVQEGNIRRLIIKESNGRTLLEVPLTLGVVAGTGVAFFAPFLAAIGVIAALVAQVQIVIERYEDPADAAKEATKTVIEVKDEKEETKS
jgi:uncharacterized membrane protein